MSKSLKKKKKKKKIKQVLIVWSSRARWNFKEILFSSPYVSIITKNFTYLEKKQKTKQSLDEMCLWLKECVRVIFQIILWHQTFVWFKVFFMQNLGKNKGFQNRHNYIFYRTFNADFQGYQKRFSSKADNNNPLVVSLILLIYNLMLHFVSHEWIYERQTIKKKNLQFWSRCMIWFSWFLEVRIQLANIQFHFAGNKKKKGFFKSWIK